MTNSHRLFTILSHMANLSFSSLMISQETNKKMFVCSLITMPSETQKWLRTLRDKIQNGTSAVISLLNAFKWNEFRRHQLRGFTAVIFFISIPLIASARPAYQSHIAQLSFTIHFVPARPETVYFGWLADKRKGMENAKGALRWWKKNSREKDKFINLRWGNLWLLKITSLTNHFCEHDLVRRVEKMFCKERKSSA